MGETAGILAGNGVYPRLLAERLRRGGISVVAAGIRGQTEVSLHEAVDFFELFPLGAFLKTFAFFTEHNVRKVFLAGGVTRRAAWRAARPDRVALCILARALGKGDDALLRRVANALEALGLEVDDPRPYIADLMVQEGLLAGPLPTEAIMADLEAARRAAWELGAKDRGQAAAALGGRVLGLEGRSGTDALIARVKNQGAVLAKVVKPGQDPRFDMPVIGPSTVIRASEQGFKAIGVQADGVLILEKEEVLKECNERRVSLIGLAVPPSH